MIKTALKYYFCRYLTLEKWVKIIYRDLCKWKYYLYVCIETYACIMFITQKYTQNSSATLVWMYAVPFSTSLLKSIPWFQNSNVFYAKLATTSSNRLKFMSFLPAISPLQGKLKGNDPWNTTLGGYGNPFNCTLLPTLTISRYCLPITLIAISLGLLYFHTYKLHLR